MKLVKNFNKASLPKFNKPLFLEGIRQLRVGGIALAALVALVSAAGYYTDINYSSDSRFQVHYCMTQRLSSAVNETTWFVFIICSIFAVLSSFALTSFNRSIKARDFYYATPHTGGTLWLNFAAAAFSWTAAGVLTFFLVSLAFLLPIDLKLFGVCLLIACNVTAALLMVFGMTMLAISLTGKTLNAIVNLAGIVLLPSFIIRAYDVGYGSIYSRIPLVTETSDISQYDPVYCVIKRLLFGNIFIDIQSSFETVFSSWKAMEHCLVIGCAILAVAAFFEVIRTGDAAGKPFVNKAAHVISLTAVTLPLFTKLTATVWKYFINAVFSEYNNNITLIVLYLLFAVLFTTGLFWAAELLLSFDLKKSPRAFKLLPVVLVLPMVLALTGFFGFKAEFNTVPSVDEVESFTLVRNNVLPDRLALFGMDNTLGRTITGQTGFTDTNMIAYLTSQIKSVSDKYGHDIENVVQSEYSGQYIDENNMYYRSMDSDGNYLINFQLNLKNGKTITRTIAFDDEHVEQLYDAMTGDSKYMKQFLALPPVDKINITLEDVSGLTAKEITAIYQSFADEYNALTDEAKLNFLDETLVLKTYEASYGDSDTPTVSFSDLNLISESKKTGDFAIRASSMFTPGKDPDIQIQIAGYPEGRLYHTQDVFYHVYDLNARYYYSTYERLFPKTFDLIIQTCNAKFKGIPEKITSQTKESEWKAWDISAQYYNGKGNKGLDISYSYLTGRKSLVKPLNKKMGDDGLIVDDKNEIITRQMTVDSNAMVEKLFKDIAKTDSVDFRKPFCIAEYNGQNGEKLTFYAQTENPLDYLHLLADEQPQTETKGKKK